MNDKTWNQKISACLLSRSPRSLPTRIYRALFRNPPVHDTIQGRIGDSGDDRWELNGVEAAVTLRFTTIEMIEY
jgi:hypothetical protein